MQRQHEEGPPGADPQPGHVRVAQQVQAEIPRIEERLDDDALMAPVNEYWTVAGVLGHIAYWDIRVLVLAEKIDRGEPWAPGDAMEPAAKPANPPATPRRE